MQVHTHESSAKSATIIFIYTLVCTAQTPSTTQIRAAYEQRALLQEESQQLQAAIWDHRQIMGGIDSAAQHNQHVRVCVVYWGVYRD